MRILSFLQSMVGKVDEILGPVNQVYFTVKPQAGVVAGSFKEGDKFFIGGDKLLPLEKYGIFNLSITLLTKYNIIMQH